MRQCSRTSELEVDERLNVAALHLDDQEDDDDAQQVLHTGVQGVNTSSFGR